MCLTPSCQAKPREPILVPNSELPGDFRFMHNSRCCEAAPGAAIMGQVPAHPNPQNMDAHPRGPCTLSSSMPSERGHGHLLPVNLGWLLRSS